MKRIAIASVVVIALSGCGSTVTSVNNTLAKLANNDIPRACSIISVAEGYFAAVKVLVPAPQRAIEEAAEAVINPICAAPPADVAAAFSTLMAAWTTVQASTHVPGTP